MKWTSDMLAILEDEFAYSNLEELASKLKVTVKALRRKAEELGLKRATNNMIIDDYKYCSMCKKEHHISRFYKNKTASFGYEYFCIDYYKKKKLNKIKEETPITTPLLTSKRGISTDIQQKVTKRPTNPIVIKNGVKGKVCNKCKEWKSLEDYQNDPKGIEGKRARCRDCYREMYKK